DLRRLVGNIFRPQAAVDRLPGLSGVIAAESACRGNSDEQSAVVGRIDKNSMQTHATGARLPFWSRHMTSQTRPFLPGLPAIVRTHSRRVSHARIHHLRIAKRRFRVPYAVEVPRMLGAVVPLVRSQRLTGFRRRVITELIALADRHAIGCLGWFAGRCSGL